MRSLSGLNPEQTQAVRLIDRHLLVVAGAGSGKTRVLTHKAAFLVEEGGVPPWAVLAVTFSNKAAGELLQRISLLLPSFERPRWVGTFHSVCLRLLKEFHEEAGLPRDFSVFDEADQLAAVKRAISDLKLDPKRYPPKSLRHRIDMAKNHSDDPLCLLQSELTKQGFLVAERYEALLEENRAVDFGGLLTKTVRLLRRNPDLRSLLTRRWQRILVDEYQDTNGIQRDLLRSLTGPDTIVCAVGDEDQAIYAWRGARVENILEYESDFPGAEVLKLERNYRSTRQILSAANGVIGHNSGRRGKTLWTMNPDGPLPEFFMAQNDYAEARFVADVIERELAARSRASDIAVFYRTHVQSRVIEEELRRRNRPYRVFGGVRFYDRAEVKHALSFLRLIVNPADDIAFRRVANVPARGVGESALSHLSSVAASRRCSMLDAIPHLDGRGKALKALREFHALIIGLRTGLDHLTPAEAAEFTLVKSGYIPHLQREGTIEAESRLDNLMELLRSMQEFAEETEGNLTAYLDRISLVSDTDAYNGSTDAVTLMTVHNSKGLEFTTVFVVGLEEGVFPHQRALDGGTPEEIEEERRLCYVAMTRAKRQLFLTAACRRRLYQSTRFNPVSRFIGEIPSSCLSVSGESLNLSGGPGAARIPSHDEYRQESFDEDFSPIKRPAAGTPLHPYAPGTRVLHPDFGLGVVKKCDGTAERTKLTIRFQAAGLKKIHLAYAELERVDA